MVQLRLDQLLARLDTQVILRPSHVRAPPARGQLLQDAVSSVVITRAIPRLGTQLLLEAIIILVLVLYLAKRVIWVEVRLNLIACFVCVLQTIVTVAFGLSVIHLHHVHRPSCRQSPSPELVVNFLAHPQHWLLAKRLLSVEH